MYAQCMKSTAGDAHTRLCIVLSSECDVLFQLLSSVQVSFEWRYGYGLGDASTDNVEIVFSTKQIHV